MTDGNYGTRRDRRRPAGARYREGSTASASPRPYKPSSHVRHAGPRDTRRVSNARSAIERPYPATRARSGTYSRPGSAYAAGTRARRKVLPLIAALVISVAIVTVAVLFVFPALFGSQVSDVEAGQPVEISIPEGTSGSGIAELLSEGDVIPEKSKFFAAVDSLGADTSLKPGDYRFTTLQDPEEVVKQLVEGPNVEGVKLTVPEGCTVAQTAGIVESTYGIPADEFTAQAKASNYAADYPMVEGAYNDSLEGFLYPKTYTFSGTPTSDEIIRVMLDQFEKEVSGLGFDQGANGLDSFQVLSLASLVERETAVESERPLVASVIYNRLNQGMMLQIDAAIVYARGGGSGTVTYNDLEIDSPYNVYKNPGLTPGPICSPSVSSIKAALQPAQTDYLYYVASPAQDGTHRFSSTDEQFESDRKAYQESLQ